MHQLHIYNNLKLLFLFCLLILATEHKHLHIDRVKHNCSIFQYIKVTQVLVKFPNTGCVVQLSDLGLMPDRTIVVYIVCQL